MNIQLLLITFNFIFLLFLIHIHFAPAISLFVQFSDHVDARYRPLTTCTRLTFLCNVVGGLVFFWKSKVGLVYVFCLYLVNFETVVVGVDVFIYNELIVVVFATDLAFGVMSQ